MCLYAAENNNKYLLPLVQMCKSDAQTYHMLEATLLFSKFRED